MQLRLIQLSLVLQVFGHKLVDNFILTFVQKSVKSERINKVITIDPEGIMNVCITLHGNLSSSCQGISIKTANVNLMVALQVKSRGPKSLGFILTGPRTSVTTFVPKHIVEAAIFHRLRDRLDLLVALVEVESGDQRRQKDWSSEDHEDIWTKVVHRPTLRSCHLMSHAAGRA